MQLQLLGYVKSMQRIRGFEMMHEVLPQARDSVVYFVFTLLLLCGYLCHAADARVCTNYATEVWFCDDI